MRFPDGVSPKEKKFMTSLQLLCDAVCVQIKDIVDDESDMEGNRRLVAAKKKVLAVMSAPHTRRDLRDSIVSLTDSLALVRNTMELSNMADGRYQTFGYVFCIQMPRFWTRLRDMLNELDADQVPVADSGWVYDLAVADARN